MRPHQNLFVGLYVLLIVKYSTGVPENLRNNLRKGLLLREQSPVSSIDEPSSSSTSEVENKRKHSSKEGCTSETSHQLLSPSPQRPPSTPSEIQLYERKCHDPEKEPQPPQNETQLPEFHAAPLRTRHRKDWSRDSIENFAEETLTTPPSPSKSPSKVPSPSISSSSLENLPVESLSEEEIKSLVKDEKYCISTNSEQKAEQLLNFDRPGITNTWLYFRHYIANDPLCSTKPNVVFLVMNPIEISSHEFFQSRGIEIPLADGSVGNRRVEFRHVSKKVIWKKFLECKCEIEDAERDVQDICVEGKKVNLSRGVGGDKSFFVYRYNPSTGYYNVIAHICF